MPDATATAEPHFILTSVAALILDVAERCSRFQKNGLLIGAPGIGKTVALEEVVRRSDNLAGPDAALVTVTAATGSSTMAIFDEMSPHLGVKASTSIADTMRRMAKSACFHPLIIFDEAQNFTLKAARELLDVGEKSNVRMLFVGNADVLRLVNSRQAAIQQIAGRLAFREEITRISERDADLIAEHFGVEELDGYRLCRRIGAVFQADGITRVLQLAGDLRGAGTTIRPGHIRAALEQLPHIEGALAEAGSLRPVREPSPVFATRTCGGGEG